MVKFTGLGIACLTLVLSGVTRASFINVDCGNYGKNDHKCLTDDKCYKNDKNCDDYKLSDDKCFKLDDCKGGIDPFDKCGDKYLKDCKDDKGCKNDKGNKDKDCKIDWRCDRNDHNHYCKHDNHDDNDCDLVIDGCYHHDDGCHSHDSCCASVPAPASAAMGGVGLLGIALMTFVRGRRSIVA